MKLTIPRPGSLAATLFILTGLSGPVLRGAEPAPPKKDEAVIMPKLSVKGEAVCSYGIGIIGTRDPLTKKIKQLFISEVAEGSEAARHGLQVGDEILSINGEKVTGMDGEVKRGSHLFDLLVDQFPGQTIELEVTVHTVKTLTLKASNEWNGLDAARHH